MSREAPSAPNAWVAIFSDSVRDAADLIASIVSTSIALASSPSPAHRRNAALSPGMTRVTSIDPFESSPKSATDSSSENPTFFRTTANVPACPIRSPMPAPVRCAVAKNISSTSTPCSAGIANCSSVRANFSALGAASSPSTRAESRSATARCSSVGPVAAVTVLRSARTVATVAADCGTSRKTAEKDSLSPSSAAPVAPVPTAIVRMAPSIVSPALTAANAAPAIGSVRLAVSCLPERCICPPNRRIFFPRLSIAGLIVSRRRITASSTPTLTAPAAISRTPPPRRRVAVVAG